MSVDAGAMLPGAARPFLTAATLPATAPFPDNPVAAATSDTPAAAHVDAATAPPLIALTAVRARLGTARFGPWDLTLRAGERIAVLGPSGAGKSTLLGLLAGDLRPGDARGGDRRAGRGDSGTGRFRADDSRADASGTNDPRAGRGARTATAPDASGGDARVRGRPLAQWRAAELCRVRAVMPQSHEVAFDLDTDLVVAAGRVGRDEPHAQTRAIVVAAAAQARAAALLGRAFHTLSGGERARVHLARVFAQMWDTRDGLLLVDEPLAAVDPGLQLRLTDAILDFAAERGHAVFAVLHDVNLALRRFERLVLMRDGRIVGDLRSGAQALAALEALYEVRFASAVGDDGTLITAPLAPFPGGR